MLKLATDFYITSIENQNYFSNSKLEKGKTYRFKYKEYKIELETQFKIIGYTKEDNIAIINFGYTVDVEKWSNRLLRYEWINGLDNENGLDTKKYFDSKEARKLVLQFIEKMIDKYLKSIAPAIIIRGAHSEIKINLPRYKRFDKQFIQNGYEKKVFNIKEYDSLYQITGNKEDTDKVIWTYSKNANHFEKLLNVIE